jgi:hypothetical protein
MPTTSPSGAQRATRWTPLLLLGAFALLAGCVGDSGGSAKLSYDGSDIGTHNDSSDCDKDGHLLGSGSIERGSVQVSVTTDEGTWYSGEFTGDFNLASQELTGQSGDWTLRVTRVGGTTLGLTGFDGSYSFTLTC